MVKEIYEMHDGIPIWNHLKNNGFEFKIILKGIDYGLLAEQIGLKEIKTLIRERDFLKNVFPEILIHSVNHRRERRLGDYCLELNYEKDGIYGKKVFILEIKHGKIEISQQQIKRYSNYIVNPSTYFRKANEVKIYFMLFTEINTINATATYSLCEFNSDFANKILDAVPKKHLEFNENIFSIFEGVHESIANV